MTICTRERYTFDREKLFIYCPCCCMGWDLNTLRAVGSIFSSPRLGWRPRFVALA